MGYYTEHKLEIIEGNDNETDYRQEINDISDYTDCFDDDIKWYSHEEDMRTFSNKYPSVLARLTGVGEEAGDMWCEYYRGGKMQRCKAEISYEDFNPNRLI